MDDSYGHRARINFDAVSEKETMRARLSLLCMKLLLFAVLASFSISAAPISIETALRNHRTLAGRQITIEGRASALSTMAKNITDSSFDILHVMPACTLVYCSNSCCNECSASVSLVDESFFGIALEGNYAGAVLGCSGNECAIRCNPEKHRRYRATGILRFEDHGDALRLWMEVERLVPIP